MAILTSKEYVDAHGGGGGVAEVFTKTLSVTSVAPADISTASTTPIEVTLGTLDAMASIDASKKYLVKAKGWLRHSTTATAQSNMTLGMESFIGDSVELNNKIGQVALVIPPSTSPWSIGEVVNFENEVVTQGSNLKSQPWKVSIYTKENVTGAEMQIIQAGLSLIIQEVTETVI